MLSAVEWPTQRRRIWCWWPGIWLVDCRLYTMELRESVVPLTCCQTWSGNAETKTNQIIIIIIIIIIYCHMYKNIQWNVDWQCEHKIGKIIMNEIMSSSVIVHRVIQGAHRSRIKAIHWSIRPGLDGAISSARLHQLKKWVRWVVLIPQYGPRFFENAALVEITNWRELTSNHSRCSWHNLVDSILNSIPKSRAHRIGF